MTETISRCAACGVSIRTARMSRHEPTCTRVKALLAEGLDDYAIAERIGLKHESVARYRRGLTDRRGSGRTFRPANRTDDATIARIRELSAEGWPPGEICVELDVSRDVVRRYQTRPENGREWRDVARWASLRYPQLWLEIQPKTRAEIKHGY